MNIETIANQVRNQDGLFSVYDVIKVCGQKSPWEVWNRLTERYPEILTKCETLQLINKAGRRDNMTNEELNRVMISEILVTDKINKDNIRNWDIISTAEDVSRKFKEFAENL